MVEFTQEEKYKIQSVVDLFTSPEFKFTINGKTLETLIVQGGMGFGVSGFRLANAVAQTGSAGTVATTGAEFLEDLIPDKPDPNLIIGANNLVLALDYEENYARSSLNADYVASGAGLSRDVIERIQNQEEHFGKKHCWTIPLFSSVAQLKTYLQRRTGYVILENIDSGGHNGDGKGFEGTLEEYRNSSVDKGNTKIIFAGGIRTPDDFVKVLDHGFDAGQSGTEFLCAIETNYKHKANVIHAGEEGWPSARRIPSVTGLAANGFPIGVIESVLKGIMPYKKPPCGEPKEEDRKGQKRCIANCRRIKMSAEKIGIDPNSISDYCIKNALFHTIDLRRTENVDKMTASDSSNCNAYALAFSGLYPEKLPKWCVDGKPIPAREIIGRKLIGAYDSIIAGTYKTLGYAGKITDTHRFFLEYRAKLYSKHASMPLRAKIFAESSFVV